MTEPTDANTGEADASQEATQPPAAAADYEGPRRRARREREERRAAQARATAIEQARREAKRRVMRGPPDESKRLGRRTVRGLKVLMWSALMSVVVVGLGLLLYFTPIMSARNIVVIGLGAVTQDEVIDMMPMQDFLRDETGYQRIQGTKPQTLGYALNDSPAGLCAWIVEKFRTWSDCDGDLDRHFTKDELLTNVMLYWVPETATSSARLYYEMMHAGKFPPQQFRVDVPTGCAIFPKEILKPPRAWVERLYNVTHWTRFARGGHFAAMEEPAALVEDIRTFFRPLR